MALRWYLSLVSIAVRLWDLKPAMMMTPASRLAASPAGMAVACPNR